MSIAVVLELQVQPGKVEGVKGGLAAILPDTRKYDGCQHVAVHQNQDDPDQLVIVEEWDSREHYEKYFAWRTETGALAQLVSALAAPPSLRYLDHVDA